MTKRPIHLIALVGCLFCSTQLIHSNAHATTDTDNITPYAMTISGGISLGNYEAGMNWAIIEAFRLARSNQLQAI